MGEARHNSVTNRSYRKVFRRRRFRALLVGGLATFLGCCFACAWGVKGFSTQTELTLQTTDCDDWTGHLRETVREHLDETSLRSAMAIVAEQSLPHPGNFSLLDKNSLGGEIRFRVEKEATAPIYRVTLSLVGEGSMEESLLLTHLANNISQQLLQGANWTDGGGQIDQQASLLEQGFDHQDSLCGGPWLSVETQLVQLDRDLQALYRQLKSRDSSLNSMAVARAEFVSELQSMLQQVREMGPVPDESAAGKQGSNLMAGQLAALQDGLRARLERYQEANQGGFTQVSHGGSGDAQVLESLEVIDPGQLNQELAEMRNALQANLAVQRETAQQLVALAQPGGVSRTFIQQEIRTTRFPVGGMPDVKMLVLFGVVSLLTGVVVCGTYRPALMDCGFRSNQHVSDLLGLPVVAEFQGTGNFQAERQAMPLGVSNRLVACAEIAMGVFVLLIVTACLLIPGIGETFVENPFAGLAKLTWVLFPN